MAQHAQLSIIVFSFLQLYMNLQPLHVCLSYQGTQNLIERLSENYDVQVQYWCEDIKDLFFKSEVSFSM